jgi:hypothetical protein
LRRVSETLAYGPNKNKKVSGVVSQLQFQGVGVQVAPLQGALPIFIGIVIDQANRRYQERLSPAVGVHGPPQFLPLLAAQRLLEPAQQVIQDP